ncbi:MAG: hypothetical protein ACM3ML_11255 [Micromonosporaceae bacterium]
MAGRQRWLGLLSATEGVLSPLACIATQLAGADLDIGRRLTPGFASW